MAALSTLGALAACTAPAHDAPKTSASPAQVLTWRGCGSGESFQAGEPVKGEPECTYLSVPTDRAQPSDGTQRLAVTRIRASGKRQGVLFVNTGGPGQPAASQVPLIVESMPESLTSVLDVVAMDPRAVGESGYLSCSDPLARSLARPVDASPDTEAEQSAYEEQIGRIGRSCAQRQPSLSGHLGTQDLARDVEDLRRALGVDQLDVLGYSYGTVLGYEYARLFPDRLHRLVLDGVVPVGASPLTQARARATSSEDALFSFASDCADENCPLGSTPEDVIDTITDLQDRLERTPVRIPLAPASAAVDEGLFTSVLFRALYTPDAAFGLADTIAPLRRGDPGPFTDFVSALADTEGVVTSNVVNGVYWATICTDSPRVGATAAERAGVVEASPVFGRMLAATTRECSDWPLSAQPLMADVLPAPTGAKVLLISNSADPTTPRAGADAVAKLLPGSAHLRVDVWGHTASFDGLSCVDDAVSAFLLKGDSSATRNGCTA